MRVENLGNKLFLITLLCAGLGLFLYIRPMLFAKDPPPRLQDRLPEAEFVGRIQIFDLARDANGLLFKEQVPFREYMTADFLLSQAKNYGIDVQDPLYFFANGEDEYGAFVTLSDSSKLHPAFQRINQYLQVKDTFVHKTKVKKLEDLGLYIYYDKHYAFIYKGPALKQRLGHAIYAKYGETSTTWERFNRINRFKNETFVLYSQHDAFKKYGIDYGMMAFTCDSSNINLKTYFHSNYDLKIKQKPKGAAFTINGTPKTAIHLHLDITEFRKDKKHPLYKIISDYARKVSFPTDDFLTAWDGDLSYLQGGIQMIEEEYIEMGIDEEFNEIQVRKTKQVPVKGFSAMMSVNEYGQQLVSKLFAKGILNKQGNKYRFLFSPPVRINIQPTQLSAYTSNGSPKIEDETESYVLFTYKGTPIKVILNRLTKRDIFSTVQIDAGSLLKTLKQRR